MTDRHRTKSPPAPARHNIAPDPPGGFAAITAIPKLIGPFAQRRTSLIAAAAGRADRDFPPRLS